MTTNRQQTVVNTKPAPYYVPPYYAYPQYGYMPPPVYNPAYVDPNAYYPPPDDGTDYLYYPVDEYGQAIGPLSRDPPVNSRYHPYPDYVSNVAAYGSYPPSPRRDQILHDNHYNYYYGGPYWHQSYGKPRDETLPPIRQERFPSTHPAPPNNQGFQQYNVRDLTHRDRVSPGLSPRNDVRKKPF